MPRPSNTHLLSPFTLAAVLALAACSKTADEPAAPAPAPTEAAPAAETPPAPTEAAPAAETPPAAKSTAVAAITVGELSALALSDGGLEVPNDNQVFGVGRTPEEVAAVLSANGLPTDKLQLSVQPLLVKAGDRVLLFDTGAGTLFGPGTGKLPASLAEAGVEAGSVTDIFISHSHGDHVGGLVNAQGALAFPNATVHLSKPEWDHMSGQDQYKAMVAAIKPKVDAFAPDAELIPGIVKAVAIKGHTPGHSGYRITSGSASLLYVGDSMHHYVISVQKPEWTIAFDGDSATASASRAAVIADSASRGQRIYAVHFPFPGVGTFEQKGEGFAWVAE